MGVEVVDQASRRHALHVLPEKRLHGNKRGG
jgi:hypothetical protein